MFDLHERISVPGATMSGLMRRSSKGPRLLKAARHSGSPDTFSDPIGGSGKFLAHACPHWKLLSPPLVRSLRLAPTVSAFLAVPGAPIESQSTKPTSLF